MWVLIGLLVPAVGAVAFINVLHRVDHTSTVLVAAHAVPTGHTLESDDVRAVDAGTPLPPGLVAASQRSSVLGLVTTGPLLDGQPLVRSELVGPDTFPPAGKARTSLEVKEGSAPPDLKPGDRVAILPGATAAVPSATGTPAPGPVSVVGVVTGVQDASASNGAGSQVVTLLVDTAATRTLVDMPDPHVVVLTRTGNEAP